VREGLSLFSKYLGVHPFHCWEAKKPLNVHYFISQWFPAINRKALIFPIISRRQMKFKKRYFLKEDRKTDFTHKVLKISCSLL